MLEPLPTELTQRRRVAGAKGLGRLSREPGLYFSGPEPRMAKPAAMADAISTLPIRLPMALAIVSMINRRRTSSSAAPKETGSAKQGHSFLVTTLQPISVAQGACIGSRPSNDQAMRPEGWQLVWPGVVPANGLSRRLPGPRRGPDLLLIYPLIALTHAGRGACHAGHCTSLEKTQSRNKVSREGQAFQTASRMLVSRRLLPSCLHPGNEARDWTCQGSKCRPCVISPLISGCFFQ